MPQAHRFHDAAAIGGQYVTAHDARRLGLALVAIADSIEREDFGKCPSLTVSVDGFDNVSELHKDKGELTHVNFRVWPESGGLPEAIIALMPESPKAPKDDSMVGSYMRVGQHGDASAELFDDLKQAHPADSWALKAELNGLGYVLREFDYYPDTSPRQAAPENESQGEAMPAVPGMPGTI